MKTKTLMTATALVALVAASPAFAQADNLSPSDPMTPPAAAPAPDAMSPDTMPPADMSPGMTEPEGTSPEAIAPDADATAMPDTALAPGDIFVTQQAGEELLASATIGATVENGAGEDLGTINDIVLAGDGSVAAVVIGVGGFLGIGEKNVGVSFDAIERSVDADGNVVLKLDATAEALEAAPTFVTVAEQRQEQEIEAPAATDPLAPSTAPGDPMAPAPLPAQ